MKAEPAQNSFSPVGVQAARGFAWMAGQTALGKLVTLLGQIVLARLLAKSDFGLYGMAVTVSSLVNIIQQTGQREVLIQRHHRFDRWASVAFWMSLTSGTINGLVMLAAAPIAAWFYGRHELLYLIMILSIFPPLNALITVPAAQMQVQLRFRAFSLVGTLYGVVLIFLTIVFAWFGCGAYSFVWPWPITAALRTVAMWALAPHRISLSPQFRRWRYLYGTSAAVFIGRASSTVITQADYIVLGLFYLDDAVLGTYYFAFILSVQTITLLAANLEAVLFPVLSKVGDPQRQRLSFVGATQLLCALAVPACLLQAGASDALLRAFFKPEYWSAAIPMAILSVGMALRCLASPSQSLIQAQGRFRVFMLVNLIGAITFVSLVTAGAIAGKYALGGQITVAIAATIYFALEGPVDMFVAIRPAGGGWSDVWHVLATPLILGSCCVGAAAALALLIPGNRIVYQWARLLGICSLAAAFYAAILRRVSPGTWKALLARAASLRHRPAAQPSSSSVQVTSAD